MYIHWQSSEKMDRERGREGERGRGGEGEGEREGERERRRERGGGGGGGRDLEEREGDSNLSKESVFLIEFISSTEGDEELGPIVVGTGISTPDETTPRELETGMELILRQ